MADDPNAGHKSWMHNPTLLWTVAGVVVALLALWATMQGGGSSGGSSSSSDGGISSADLTSQVNAVNADAAAVTQSAISAEATTEQATLAGAMQYASYDAGQTAGVENNVVNNATEQLNTVEGAQTARYATLVGATAGDYGTELNALTTEFGDQVGGFATLGTAANAGAASEVGSVGSTTSSEIGSEASQAASEAQSSAQASEGWTNMFGNIFRAAGSVFSGGLFSGIGGIGAVGTPSNPAQIDVPAESNVLQPATPSSFPTGLSVNVPQVGMPNIPWPQITGPTLSGAPAPVHMA